MWNTFKDRIDTKLEHKVDRGYVDDHIKSAIDKIETYEAYNSRAHGEMKTEITMCETRSTKGQDDLRQDYARGLDAVNKRLDDIINLLKNGK